MHKTIKSILSDHKITNPLLLTELADFYSKAVWASLEYGKRQNNLTGSEEHKLWRAFEDSTLRGDEGELEKIKEKYRICRK